MVYAKVSATSAVNSPEASVVSEKELGAAGEVMYRGRTARLVTRSS